ncbi:MAG: hypothetical protein ACTSQJ_18525, partial [Promethearchaeota archaeon]
MSDEENKNKESLKAKEQSRSPLPPSEPYKRPRMSQTQMIQEALGLDPMNIQEIEKKLFIARFFDFFSEETLDFVYKDRSIEQYKSEIYRFLDSLERGSEEDKLLRKELDDKEIFDLIYSLKKKAEDIAFKNGIKETLDKRMRKLSLIVTLPMFGLIILFLFLPPEYFFLSFILLCFFCMIPQMIRANIIKKWFDFKEFNRHEFYRENRKDILILKDYTGKILENIRAKLLDLKVPLQLIKFTLHSRDYDNLKVIYQRNVRGTPHYFFTFEYPKGMKPFPIPESLMQLQQPLYSARQHYRSVDKPEQNFIVLTEMKGKDGIIKNFIPT